MVVLVVEVASNGTTVRRGDPQVGAASVEDDLELLGRVADGNLGEVWIESEADQKAQVKDLHTLSVQEVADSDGVTGLSVHGGLLEHLIGVLLGANTHVLLAESLHVLANVCALL